VALLVHNQEFHRRAEIRVRVPAAGGCNSRAESPFFFLTTAGHRVQWPAVAPRSVPADRVVDFNIAQLQRSIVELGEPPGPTLGVGCLEC
jgi:hypothetical protein